MLLPAAIALCSGLLSFQYHSIFDPVPQEEMRPMATDRPDTTESAITVDAGHLQLEMDGVVFGVDRSTRNTELTLMGVNLKVGLLPSVDLQLVLPPLGVSVVKSDLKMSGQDALIRLKWNVFGNDGGPALAIMPFVVGYTSDVDGALPVGGGAVVPFGIPLPADFSLTGIVMAEMAPFGNQWFPGGVATLCIGHALPIDGFAAYFEGIAVLDHTLKDDSRLTASGGVTWGVTPDVQLDAGSRLPVVGNGGAWEGFVGVSIRR
jgi:hypothetical protein